ncbi:MAG: 3-deoxy-7-phosphoheptulonate synthase [Saprospiraceae bacterium]|nr:3-deoxy-7-phosphoheptulonate synthase [Saprospiraceae bacterium]
MTNLEFKPLYPDWTGRPIVMAGPCSAESEEQVLETARALASQNIHLFRAGIWKPRTRPNSFEGVGSIGLKWLKKVKEETGLKVTTEVANRNHLSEALKFGVDVIWIGARTTVNPFSVQEIADGLQGVDIPVLIKNPINPDLNLWIGAIERIYKAGIQRIGVVHRGFSHYGNSPFRNEPRWSIPIELMRRFPDLTVICDNSHICGNRHMLGAIAQRAMDLNYHGLMTETHPNPDEAWSDAKQQITPEVFGTLIADLKIRDVSSSDESFLNHLEDLRHQIDLIDDQLLTYLGVRMELARKIGEYKKDNSISILQPSRWNEIVETAVEKGKGKGLSEIFIEKLLTAVHQESISQQNKVMNQ